MSQDSQNHDDTLALHFGVQARELGGPVSPSPAFATSFYTHPDVMGFSAHDLPTDAPHFYTRWGNPTLDLLEKRLAILERGEAAISFASGMAAISALLFHCLKPGDHLLLSDVCYAGTSEFACETLTRYGVEVTKVDTSDLDKVTAAVQKNTRLIHIEIPANPTLKLTDVQAVAEIAHHAGAKLSVDSTIATPVGTKPLLLGADYVVHSLTKYLCGHGDVLAGAVIGSEESMTAMRKTQLVHFGGTLSPFSAWLLLRGMETLGPRMAVHEKNARELTNYLENHPLVENVYWPGSHNHPQHQLAQKQMKNFSGLLSFKVKANSAATATRVADRIKLFSYAVSLGKTKSLIFYIPTDDILRTSLHLNAEQIEDYRRVAGEGLFRVSAGLEDAGDLIADLDQALASR